MGLFDDLFGGGAAKRAAEKNRQLYDNYGTQGGEYLQQGYDTGVSNVNKAIDSFGSLADLGSKYGGATTMLLNGLGVNGATGGQAAWDAFQIANPQTQGAIDAGLEAINRRRAAAGMLNSGNSDADALRFAQNTQNQQYGSWLSNLGSFVSPELSATAGAATGKAAGYGDLASLASNYATNRTGLLGQVTSGQAGANNMQAQGEAQGMGNLLGLGKSLLSLGTGGVGGLFGGFGSSLGGLGLGSGSSAGTTGRLY